MRNVALLAAACLLAAAAAWGQEKGSIPDKAVKQITEAMPEKPPAKPGKGRRILVYGKCLGYRHGSIPYAARALEIMGEKTGAFDAVVTYDPADFEPGKLKGFDAVVLNNTTGALLMPGGKELKNLSEQQRGEALEAGKRRRKALLDFVSGGKGLIGIHAATDCAYKWKQFGGMIGGYFDGHPWHEVVGIKVDRPDHPLNAAFEGEGFTIKDEIYQFGPGRAGWDPYSRRKNLVLLSLDMSKTKDKGKRKDDDYAVSWVKAYGKGRVFYCSLGHRREIFWNRKVLRHYLAGIQFALGDLDAPAAPPQAKGDWEVLFDGSDLSKWDYKEGGWHIEDGAIAWRRGCGFIWSKQKFGDFVLSLDFKVSKGANSGIFIRTGSRRNWLHSGIEVQILDSYGKEKVGKHDCGAIYDCLAPSANAVKKPGQWNHVEITCEGPQIDVVLNGEQIIDMDLNRWTEAHRNPDGSRNKFNRAYKDMPREGYIGFQDHGRPVWYRNVKVKELGG